MIYGYARISTRKQNIDRQIENILREDSTARIYSETFTGTTTQRPVWNKLLRVVRPGDTIIFDEVSRMSRDAEEGFRTYTELYDKGVTLVFIKEPHISTTVFKNAVEHQINVSIETGNAPIDDFTNTLIEALKKLLLDIAEEQIRLAFESAQKEVDYLHRRTSEGVRNAQAKGKIIGRKQGAKVETKKAQEKKKDILKHSVDFGGSLSDRECIELTGLSRNTFYKYKRELKLTSKTPTNV
jgi:DNA invertase Pin-like site-specific DNA recombinase